MIRKKGEFYLSFWWIFCWVFLAGIIILATLVFYGRPMDTREAESKVLANVISRCIFENGVFDVNETKEVGFFSLCQLNNKSFEKGSNFFIYAALYDSKTNIKVYEFSAGQSSFMGDCNAIGEEIKAENYPRCTYKNESIRYLDDKEVKEGVLEILTASNQHFLNKKSRGEKDA